MAGWRACCLVGVVLAWAASTLGCRVPTGKAETLEARMEREATAFLQAVETRDDTEALRRLALLRPPRAEAGRKSYLELAPALQARLKRSRWSVAAVVPPDQFFTAWAVIRLEERGRDSESHVETLEFRCVEDGSECHPVLGGSLVEDAWESVHGRPAPFGR